MADLANRSYLRLCVAKICQDVGFNSIQSTPLEVLTDLLQDYMMALAKTAYNYALHCGNTEPNLNHLALAFKDMGVSIAELKEYVRYVDSSAVFECPKYPVSKESHLNLLKPGSREVVTRPFHIHEHLPPMHPHLEDQDLGIKEEPNAESSTPESSPLSNSKSKTFKRPGDSVIEGSTKRSRFVSEEEGRPLRELASVVMTTSGFLSPAREGKLPEARTPIVRPDLNNQESNSSSNPGSNSTEQKVKKKAKVLPEDKKIDKESKAQPEKEQLPVEKEEEVIKQKRPNGGKESVKKLKSSSGKNILSSSNNSNSIKPHKQGNKVKNSSTSNSPSSTFPKSIKINISKTDKVITSFTSKEGSSSSIIQAPSEYKIASEPDKQKLNIFKKISKVKDDLPEEGDEKVIVESNSLSRVDVTIESVIKQMVSIETPVQDADTKDEVVDIETVHSPNPYQTLLTTKNEEPCDNIPLITPTVIVKPEKKKKKIKKAKKEHFPQADISVIKSIRLVSETAIDEIMEEIVDVNLPPQEPFPLVEITPEKLPSPEPEPFIVVTTPPMTEPLPIEAEPVEPPPLHNQPTTEGTQLYTSPPVSVKNQETALELLSKKKIHKKDKKDKLKKKKKDKIKNKEKSEKRKLKLEKKNKDKEKQRIKKEKKEKRKEKEAEELKTESTSAVPKITLKLGPPVSPNSNTDSNTRKIVIIPVVKKEKDEGSRAERAPSPELARFSPLVPNPKQKPNKSVASEDVKLTTESKIATKITTKITTTTPACDLIESSSLPPSVKLDKHGNKVWICPACGRRDDGSPMIGCDGCDAWYHWVCVGIQVPPEVQKWFCNACLSKKKSSDPEKKKKKKKNLNKKSKEN